MGAHRRPPPLDDWLAYASRCRPAPFVKLARTIRRYRASIQATIAWRLTKRAFLLQGPLDDHLRHLGQPPP